jgi:inner membrane transporter RhtA
VLAVSASFQTGSALATRVIRAVGVGDALWLRTAIAAVILVAVRPSSLRLPPPRRRLAMVWLTVALFAMNLSFYGAISHAPLGVVVAVEYLGPLGVAVIGSRRALDFAWIALAAAGVLLLAAPSSTVSALGLGLAFVAACSWGTYLVLARHAVKEMQPLHVTTLMIAGSAVLATPFVATGAVRLTQHPSAVALGAAVAVLSSAAPYFIELITLRLVRAATYGVLLSLSPAVAATAGFLVAGQSLTATEVLAIAAVVIAAAGASWSGARRA